MRHARAYPRVAHVVLARAAFDDGGGEAELGGANRRDHAGETAADGDQVEFRFAHNLLPRHAGGGGRQPSMASL